VVCSETEGTYASEWVCRSTAVANRASCDSTVTAQRRSFRVPPERLQPTRWSVPKPTVCGRSYPIHRPVHYLRVPFRLVRTPRTSYASTPTLAPRPWWPDSTHSHCPQ